MVTTSEVLDGQMSERIQVGDLVMVVGVTHLCPRERGLGRIETVVGSNSGAKCSSCGHIIEGPIVLLTGGGKNGWGRPAWCLKKIPPLSELESTHEKERIEA